MRISKIWFMVFNATFSNISVISWWSVLLVEYPEKTRISKEKINNWNWNKCAFNFCSGAQPINFEINVERSNIEDIITPQPNAAKGLPFYGGVIFFFLTSISQILFSKYLVTFLLQSPSSSKVSLWNAVSNVQRNTQNYNYI